MKKVLKQLLRIILVSLFLFISTYLLHSQIENLQATPYSFDLFKVYIFHLSYTLILCASFELVLFFSPPFKEQLGFIYLASVVLKIFLFFIFFSEVLLQSALFTKGDKIALLIPLFIFTFFEVMVTVKMLSRTS